VAHRYRGLVDAALPELLQRGRLEGPLRGLGGAAGLLTRDARRVPVSSLKGDPHELTVYQAAYRGRPRRISEAPNLPDGFTGMITSRYVDTGVGSRKLNRLLNDNAVQTVASIDEWLARFSTAS
jgi:hypothetical protein